MNNKFKFYFLIIFVIGMGVFLHKHFSNPTDTSFKDLSIAIQQTDNEIPINVKIISKDIIEIDTVLISTKDLTKKLEDFFRKFENTNNLQFTVSFSVPDDFEMGFIDDIFNQIRMAPEYDAKFLRILL